MARSRDPRLAAGLLAAALACALAGGRAAAVPPLSGGETPGDVLHRMQKAVETRNPRDYTDCLADTFRFTPWLGVVSAYPGTAWSRWGKAQETVFAGWLCSPVREARLDLTGDVLERGLQAGGRADWDVIYTLTVGGTVFRGRATLSFVEIRQWWYLARWVDTGPEPWQGRAAPTSGEIRAVALNW